MALAQRPLRLDRPDHLRVQAEPRVEGEVPAHGQPEPDAPLLAGRQRADHLPHRVHRVRGQPQRPGEHVRAAARQRGERGQQIRRGEPGGPARGHDPVDRLVGRAVPAQREHQAVAVGQGGPGQPGGVTPVPCFGNRQVHCGGQGPGDNIPPQSRRRSGAWVDDQEGPHPPRVATVNRSAGNGSGPAGPPGTTDGAARRGGAGGRCGAAPRGHRAGRGGHRRGQVLPGRQRHRADRDRPGHGGPAAAGRPRPGPGPAVGQDPGPADPAVHRHRRDLPGGRAAGSNGGSRPWPCPRPGSPRCSHRPACGR